jgi:predicted ABC-type transport system involved in lysophospholipase L1 biosynthesis ATPase subunit
MAQSPVLELSGLVKSLRTRKRVVRVLRRVDLSIRAGEIVALLGPKGEVQTHPIELGRPPN